MGDDFGAERGVELGLPPQDEYVVKNLGHADFVDNVVNAFQELPAVSQEAREIIGLLDKGITRDPLNKEDKVPGKKEYQVIEAKIEPVLLKRIFSNRDRDVLEIAVDMLELFGQEAGQWPNKFMFAPISLNIGLNERNQDKLESVLVFTELSRRVYQQQRRVLSWLDPLINDRYRQFKTRSVSEEEREFVDNTETLARNLKMIEPSLEKIGQCIEDNRQAIVDLVGEEIEVEKEEQVSIEELSKGYSSTQDTLRFASSL